MYDNPIRQQVATDMKMAGLSPQTQGQYLNVIDRFFRRTWLAPEQVTEQVVRNYLNREIERGAAHGSLKPTRFALQFLFQNTLGRDWDLFKKESQLPGVSVCPASLPTRNAASCLVASGIRSIAPACA